MHALPQDPQLAESLFVSTHTPAVHSVRPPSQTQLPPLQLWPVAQARPHPLQLSVLVIKSTQLEPHGVYPGWQPVLLHTPAEHT